MNVQIVNAEKVIEYLGYWPKFCDAKITRFCFDMHEKNVELALFYIDPDQGKDLKIGFSFGNVSNANLNSLLIENVVDELIFDMKDGVIQVDIEGAYGLRGKILCGIVSVVHIQTNTLCHIQPVSAPRNC